MFPRPVLGFGGLGKAGPRSLHGAEPHLCRGFSGAEAVGTTT